MQTPALVVNDKVLSYGKLLSPKQYRRDNKKIYTVIKALVSS